MTESDSARPLLQASLSLAASLLEAVDAESSLRAFMRVCSETLGAEGCVFLPFDEFSAALPPLTFGRVPAFDADALSRPAWRQACKVCETRRSGGDCPLLERSPEPGFVRCLPLRSRGREAGLFSFVFSAEPNLDAPVERFLADAAILTALALEAERSQPPHSIPDTGRFQPGALPQAETRVILQERARLAREIHDGLAQTLAFLKIEIGRAENFLAEGDSGQAARILKNSSRTLGDAYLDARQAIENLRRAPDDRLEGWLAQAAENFAALSGLTVETHLQLSHDFPAHVQVQLIRIVQEALTNVRKHARARCVSIAAWEEDGEARIEVQDDGCGFRPADPLAAARFGLRGMRERAESVGAEFQVVARPNGGTVIRLSIPLKATVEP